MERLLNKKFAISLIILAIMIGAFAVRFYNHDEWLYFKMDQARDSFLVAKAVENGPGYLPMLGPRAGATDLDHGFLNLGPIFYYFQYFSGVIFNSTSPEVFAYPDLFFSIAVLPLLYAFCRLYFKKYTALLVVLMYAFSFLIIQYSRFAWNPNSLPFFTILSFFALLKLLNTENEKSKKWWTVLWASGLAIGSQLHFVGFFSLVGVSGLLIFYHYGLWKKAIIRKIFEKVNLKKIAFLSVIFAAVFLFFYTPVIISDIFKGGENARNFVAAISSKPTEQTFLQKFGENINQQIEHYTLITTSYIYPKKISAEDSFPIIFTVATLILGIFLIVKNAKKDDDNLKKDFLVLLLLWFGVFFVLCIPLAFQIRPRFFIFTFAIPFLFSGLIIEFLEEKRIKYYQYVIIGLVAFVLLFNFSGISAWFLEQRESQLGDVTVKRTLILKTKDGVTLGQLQKAVDYIYDNRGDESNIYFYAKPEHIRPIKYLFQQKNNPNFNYSNIKINDDPKAQYFAIVPTGSGAAKIENKFKEDFSVLSSVKFGQTTVHEINFINREVSDEFEEDDGGGSENRIFWKDIF